MTMERVVSKPTSCTIQLIPTLARSKKIGIALTVLFGLGTVFEKAPIDLAQLAAYQSVQIIALAITVGAAAVLSYKLGQFWESYRAGVQNWMT